VRRAKDARAVRPLHLDRPSATRPGPRNHGHLPHLRLLHREEPQDRARHARMRRVPERVRGGGNAAFDSQVQPRVPHRVHRRMARQSLHLSRLSRQPCPQTGRALCFHPNPGSGSTRFKLPGPTGISGFSKAE